MKTLIVTFAVYAVAVAPSFAEFSLSNGVTDADKLEKAEEKAKKFNRPVAFLVSDTKTTCPLCSECSRTMMKELSQSTVMVYTNVKQSKVPAPVTKLAASEVAKVRVYPYVIVVDPEYKQLIGVLTYDEVKKDSNKAFTEIKTAIRKAKKPTA